MWNLFQRYRALDPQARSYFRKAVRLLPWVALSLKFRGFNRTREGLQAAPPVSRLTGNFPGNPAETVQRICRMVKAASRYGIGNPTCLAQSLVLWLLLREAHVPADLRIGVNKSSERFEAHAWVEYNGAALNQPDDVHRHYAAFDKELMHLPEAEP